MPEFLILKLEGDSPRDAKITTHVVFDGEAADAMRQGFDGEGRYAVVNWDERVEADLRQGPVAISAVEDKTVRESAAEAESSPAKEA